MAVLVIDLNGQPAYAPPMTLKPSTASTNSWQLAAQLLQNDALLPVEPLGPDTHETLWLPPLDSSPLLLAEAKLRRICPSPLVRVDTLSLLKLGATISDLAGTNYSPGYLLATAARVSLRNTARLLRTWPTPNVFGRARLEDTDDLEIWAEEWACFGHTLSPWVSDESLERISGDDPYHKVRLMNALRRLRLQEEIGSRWMAESMLPRVESRLKQKRLVWTVGVPLSIVTPEAYCDVEEVIAMEDLGAVRNAATRRKRLTHAIAAALKRSDRVLCVANNTTVESRAGLLLVADDAGASSHALYFDRSPDWLEAQNEAAGWPIARRLIQRARHRLESPRPHEAEEVLVIGDDGSCVRWCPGVGRLDGFEERGVVALT